MSLEIPTDWTDPSMFKHKGVYFMNDLYTPESIDAVEHFETRESDVFLVTYPKSGTIWTQQILSLIFNERHRNGTEVIDNQHRVPWIECNFRNIDYNARPSPRLFPSHLHYYLMPKELRNWKGKVIYVSRNPKDCMVSFYHFHNLFVKMTKARNWNHYFELFVSGKVFHGSWFEHIRGWYTHKEDFNFLFITYEKMKKDLQSAVLKICQFVGNELSKQEVDTVVEKSTFKSMKQDPLANYTFINKDILDTNKGNFLRKGIVGDWKNLMTVAQNERFEKIYQEKMKDLPISYTYDFYSKN